MKPKDEIYFEGLDSVQTICVYGEGDFDFFLFLKKWLKKKEERKIIFLEDENQKYQELIIQTRQFFPSENIKHVLIQGDLKQVLKQIAWDCVYLNLKILKSSHEKRNDAFAKISQILNEMRLGANVTSFIYADFGVKSFENVYNNLLNAGSFILLESLAGKFKNIPAIIAGAGPSLDKNIDLLRGLYDRALIFAGGSALNVFSKKNIKFHFSGFVDQSHFFKKFCSNHFFENAFLYSNQMSHYNLSAAQANKILVNDFGAYPLESWIYDQLSIKQNIFEAGWNVTTFLIKIAAYLECNPIYFVGLDLCYKNGKYAKGVVKTEESYDLIKTKNMDGEEVYTQKDWILAKKWIEEFALESTKIKFINIAGGGLKFENISDLDLNELVFGNTLDLSGYVRCVYEQQKKIRINKEKVFKIMQVIKKSLEKSDLLCDEYLSRIEKKDFDLYCLKFQKEITYVYLLDPLWQIWKHVILRRVENNEVHILINKLLFFKNVIASHLEILRKVHNGKI